MSQDLRLNKKKSRYSLEVNLSKTLLDPDKESQKLSSVVMNSSTMQLIEENGKNYTQKMFSPKASKTFLLSKKQEELLSRYRE